MTLTQERLKSLLRYEPETGHFYWLVASGRARVDALAGCRQEGYIDIKIDGRKHKAHRLAFLYETGLWPTEQVDHINGVRSDNRWFNLRPATPSQNCHNQRRPHSNNRSSRHLGVSWHKASRRWLAQISVRGKVRHIGTFSDEDAAHIAYLAAKRECHPYGEIAREAA